MSLLHEANHERIAHDECGGSGRGGCQSEWTSLAVHMYGEDEVAIPCKYRELPSQNNGIIPQMPEDYEIPAPANTTQTTLPQVAPKCDCEYKKLSEYVACTLHDYEPHSALDDCTDMDPIDPENPDAVCRYCKYHKELFIKG